MPNIWIWAIAWALALWLAWQKQGDLLSPSVALPLLMLMAIGWWGWRKPKD